MAGKIVCAGLCPQGGADVPCNLSWISASKHLVQQTLPVFTCGCRLAAALIFSVPWRGFPRQGALSNKFRLLSTVNAGSCPRREKRYSLLWQYRSPARSMGEGKPG